MITIMIMELWPIHDHDHELWPIQVATGMMICGITYTALHDLHAHVQSKVMQNICMPACTHIDNSIANLSAWIHNDH